MIPFVDVTLSQNDKRLLFVLLIVFVIVFVLLGIIGALIRKTSNAFARRMDYEIHDAVTMRVIQTPEQLKKYGRAKNRRRFFVEAVPPFCIALISVLVYLAFAFITGEWNRNCFVEFADLLYVWDWADPEIHTTFFGLDIIREFPKLLNSPHFVNEHLASYILVPVWFTSIVYYLIVIQAFLARWSMTNKRSHSVFEKSLDGFNHFKDEEKGTNEGAKDN